jgi:predicted glycoside hydrolase/deacetylase ChbG (UPF0249 family)
MQLIFNADDFGLCEGVNYGIINAYRDGLVRSTTIMSGMIGFEHALTLAKANPDLKIGVHLNLTTGKSLGKGYRTLTNDKGTLLDQRVFVPNLQQQKVDLNEIEQEYELQIKKVLDAGIVPTHFDGHHHMNMQPQIRDIFFKLVRKYNVAARLSDEMMKLDESKGIKTVAHFDDGFYGDAVTMDSLKSIIIQHANCKSMEIMCHPAFVDPYLYRITSYSIKRITELELLTSSEMKDFIKENKIELCSYADL